MTCLIDTLFFSHSVKSISSEKFRNVTIKRKLENKIFIFVCLIFKFWTHAARKEEIENIEKGHGKKF